MCSVCGDWGWFYYPFVDECLCLKCFGWMARITGKTTLEAKCDHDWADPINWTSHK